ncbi:hypothetical protein [Actinokineospora iranica]|uniref:Uncharacterized protein n=1 Tax=Actinokineospora iranica TaxID=1271860 RepID=A0A1G6Z6A7_9PSEU|nr:hypothetical protein [Actinokineospora iranica]SDD98294.1 hypothetical protein SAMN05216174_12627 [Actinokineospora iranica]
MSDPDWAQPWDAAFGPTPGLCPPAVESANSRPRESWLAAVALGGRGYYAAAAARLWPLVRGPDAVLAALAAAALASHRRQLGDHAGARSLDGTGLRALADAGLLNPDGIDADHSDRAGDPTASEGADARAARSDVLLGLAADAVGLGRPDEARRLFGIEATSADAGWRAVIRRGWVAAEIELSAGRAAAAVAPARAAERAAARSASVRHRAKSALVLGAALAAAGERAAARESITVALAAARRHGLRPLVWPCALVLADLDPAGADGHRRVAAAALHCVLRHADPGARRSAESSPWVPTWMFVLAPNR